MSDTRQGTVRGVRGTASAVARRGIDVVRRGSRTVLLTHPETNFGNFLYLWMKAYSEQQAGHDVLVSRTPRMDPWLEYVPYAAAHLVIDRDAVRLLDRRDLRMFQGWASDYVPEQVSRFVDSVLLPSELPLARREDEGRVVVNIRRGDFFSARYAPRYAFDPMEYLSTAMSRSVALGGPVEEFHVVSDDLEWCRRNVTGLLGEGGAAVTFAADGSTPAEHFGAVASSRRLILTHSTFGYWGAHVSNALHGTNHEQVVVPWFHDRTVWGGESYMLNPSWTVVRNLPGGWGPPAAFEDGGPTG